MIIRRLALLGLLAAAACSNPSSFENVAWPCLVDADCMALGLVCLEERVDGQRYCGVRDGGVGDGGVPDGGPRDGGPPPRDGGPQPIVKSFCQDDQLVPDRTDWWLYVDVDAAEVEARVAEHDAFPEELEVETDGTTWRYDVVLVDNSGPNAREFFLDTMTTSTFGSGGWSYDLEYAPVAPDILLARVGLVVTNSRPTYRHVPDPRVYFRRISNNQWPLDIGAYRARSGNTVYSISWARRLETDTSTARFRFDLTRDELADTFDDSSWAPFDLEVHPNGHQSAFVRPCPHTRTWWVSDWTVPDILARTERDGSRIHRLERRQSPLYAALLVNNLGPLATSAHRLIRAETNGLAGYAVHDDVGGRPAAHLDDRTISAGAFAMWWVALAVDDAIANGTLSSSTSVSRYADGAPCPGPETGATETVADALQRMITTADAASAKALVVALGGVEVVDTWRNDRGLTNSRFSSLVGCDTPANANRTTLHDLAAAARWMGPTFATAPTGVVRTIAVDEGATAAFLTPTTVLTGTDGDLAPARGHRTAAGVVTVPRCDPAGTETFGYALWIEDDGGPSERAFAASQHELLRQIVRRALAGDLSCL